MSTSNSDALLDIAIIGMAGRFPGARDPEALWRAVRDGRELISHVSDAELEAAGIPASVYGRSDYVKAAAVLDDVDCFDGEFFGYSPREAALMDPQHRLFVECAWAALERAGYPPIGYHGRVGVYASASINTYLYFALQAAEPDLLQTSSGYQFAIASEKDYLATRVSYLLNLNGPSVNVQTACSSSLVAVHYACQSLLNGECDIALAGASTVKVPHRVGYTLQEGTTARDGHCRPFDSDASGTVFGSGVGVVALKRVGEALADGDTIYAVIKSTAINNDGRDKVGYSAPSSVGQAAVIREAIQLSGVDAGTIGYVEAHGTATPLGDPIEIAGLTEALSDGQARTRPCAIGSIKSNIGHLEAAAGVTGLIKTAMALQHGQIPPSLHFSQTNPEIDLRPDLVRVQTELTPWPNDDGPRRAGVSSFGIGGTNAHAILEEAPNTSDSAASATDGAATAATDDDVRQRAHHVLVLSAKTPAALKRGRQALADHLQRNPDIDIADAAYTLQVGRTPMAHRVAVVCGRDSHQRDRQRSDVAAALRGELPGLVSGGPVHGSRPVAFAFPGGGAQHVNMARELMAGERVFRAAVDACVEGLRPHLPRDIREVLYPSADAGAEAPTAINDPDMALPALFAVEYALAQLWMSWGVQPKALIGHSFGEYVAACVAGVFSLPDALALVARRSQLIARLPAGGMLSVAAAPQAIASLLPANSAVSLINAPELCVVSGPDEELDALAQTLEVRAIKHRRVHFGAAMHTPHVDPVVPELVEFIGTLERRAPKIPYISNVTGTWITAAQATDPGYWARHMREPVRFSDGVVSLLSHQPYALVEIGPGQGITNFVRQHPASVDEGAEGVGARGNRHEHGPRIVVSSLPHVHDDASDEQVLLRAAATLWTAGVDVDWAALHTRERPRRIPLPTYAFERTRHWIAPEVGSQTATDTAVDSAMGARRASPGATGKRADMADWFYIPSWRRALLPARALEAAGEDSQICLLLLPERAAVGPALVRELRDRGYAVAVVQPGTDFSQIDHLHWTVNPQRPEDYQALIAALCRAVGMPQLVAHMWSLSDDAEERPGALTIDKFYDRQKCGLFSLLFLAQALVSEGKQKPLTLCTVSNDVYQVSGHEHSRTAHATLMAAVKVISQEYLNITARAIDDDLGNQNMPPPNTPAAAHAAAQAQAAGVRLARELTSSDNELVVAYRGGQRWIQQPTPVRIAAPDPDALPLRQGGVFLITGGCGNVGLDIAEYLARTVGAKLVLVGRSAYPARARWQELAVQGSGAEARDEDRDGDRQRRVVRRLLDIEAQGGEVLLVQADVCNKDQMAAAFAHAEDRFGRIDGVIHGAGHVGESTSILLREFNRDLCREELSAKVEGTLILDELCRARTLDVRMLVSSVSAVLGGLGHFAYSAANAFIDAFAQQTTGTGTGAWLSWGSELWDNAPGHDHASVAGYAMTSEEGVETFVRALACEGAQHLMVSSGSLNARIDQWVRLDEARRALHGDQATAANPANTAAAGTAPTEGVDRPVSTDFIAPATAVEEEIAAIWSKHLGISHIGANDNFFELGGHSLLATQIVAQIREAFQTDISMRLLYKSPTIRELAQAIEDALLAELEDMSEEEAQALLAGDSVSDCA